MASFHHQKSQYEVELKRLERESRDTARRTRLRRTWNLIRLFEACHLRDDEIITLRLLILVCQGPNELTKNDIN